MKDTVLWRSLQRDDLDADALLPLLAELAAARIDDRLPLLGLIPRLLDADDPRLRIAGIESLAGATGVPVWRRLVAALDDADPGVRAVAVGALWRSARGPEAGRRAHVVFHDDPSVRREAARRADDDESGLTLLLLADEAHRDLVLERLPRGLPGAEMLRLIADVIVRRLLPEPVRRRLLDLAGSIDDGLETLLDEALHAQPAPSAAQLVGATLAAARADDPAAVAALPIADGVDGLLELAFLPESSAPPARRRGLLDVVAAAARATCLAQPRALRLRVALLRAGARSGRWPPAAARLCLELGAGPSFLDHRWVPEAVRIRAALELEPDAKPRRLPRKVLARLLARRADRLDAPLAVGHLVGIVRFSRDRAIRLVGALGLDRVVKAAVSASVDEVVALVLVPNEAAAWRRGLLRRILDALPEARRAPLLAAVVVDGPADRVAELLESLDPPLARALLIELLRHEASVGPLGSDAKVDRLLATLEDAIDEPLLEAWLGDGGSDDGDEEPDASRPRPRLAHHVVGRVARALVEDAGRLAALLARLDAAARRRFRSALDRSPSIPWPAVTAVAAILVDGADPDERAWAGRLLGAATASTPSSGDRPATPAGDAVDAAEAVGIIRCAEPDLDALLAARAAHPSRGVCGPLLRRPRPSGSPPLNAVMAAIVGHDPLAQVATTFEWYAGAAADAFFARLDAAMVRHHATAGTLGLLGRAWLHRWETHAIAVGRALIDREDGPAAGLEELAALPSPRLALAAWRAAAGFCGIARYRHPELLTALLDEASVAVCVGALRGPLGPAAGKMLARLHASGAGGALLAAHRDDVIAMLPHLDAETLGELGGWVDARGLVAAAGPARDPAWAPPDPERLAAVRACDDVDALVELCASGGPRIIEEAAFRLLELGVEARERLAGALALGPRVGASFAAVIALWPNEPSLEAVRAVLDGGGAAELRFAIAIGLIDRGEASAAEAAFAIVAEPCSIPWFGDAHWKALVAAGIDEVVVATHLATSPQPSAYVPAVRALLTAVGDPVRDALAGFLDAGTDRLASLRVDAAAALLSRHGDRTGVPVLLREVFARRQEVFARRRGHEHAGLLAFAPRAELDAAVDATLVAGWAAEGNPEGLVLELLERPGVDAAARVDAWTRMLTDTTRARTRSTLLARMPSGPRRASKLARLAEAFAWGVLRGRELTGRLLRIAMLAEGELGYTRLGSSTIHVNVLPLLREERHGDDVVRGLILHEIGHHRYHRGPDAEGVWEEAARERLAGTLNLVADEHLERNLRAVDGAHGDKLKRLAAWAFQHSSREVPVSTLVDALLGRSFEVLVKTRLRPARAAGAVRVPHGRLLRHLEQAGGSLARFVRALRMGLGDRTGDPKVAAGLVLFGRRSFRDSSMEELLEIARALRRIFGAESALLETFGLHGLASGDEAELAERADGIGEPELQAEVQRVLRRRGKPDRGRGGRGGPLEINVDTDESFDRITTVVPIPFDPAAHRAHAAQVAGPPRRMRETLRRLGLGLERVRRRTRGKELDRARLGQALARGDPRILVARRTIFRADLFLGLVIDCSGSMATGRSMEKARLFGTLLAEASRGLSGVDTRVLGFTDAVIYDAGTADRCAVASLEDGGGNNDAAALVHAAALARASRRKAKLLVMISDGLPTECSVEALRTLVGALTHRQGIACAQVAVRPLEEVCFPHYVELAGEDDLSAAVRRFAEVVLGLVGRTLRAV